MHVDSHGLPCQADGNCADQLQRVGMILIATYLNPLAENMELEDACIEAVSNELQPTVGVYTRYVGATTDDVTCDQLVPAIAHDALINHQSSLKDSFVAMCKRFGFAQNKHRQGAPETKTTPDFMFFRTLPLFVRYSKWLYPVAMVTDVYLILMVISCVLLTKADQNLVDDNNLIVTLITCLQQYPTFVSKFAGSLYAKYRPVNYGVTKLGETSNIMGTLAWYHRAEAGGNPEIAELFRPVIIKTFQVGA